MCLLKAFNCDKQNDYKLIGKEENDRLFDKQNKESNYNKCM